MQQKKPLKDKILKCRRKCIVPLPPPFQELSLKKESGDRLCEWGAKLFYFCRQKMPSYYEL